MSKSFSIVSNSAVPTSVPTLNEAIFGPLQLTGDFSYTISNTCEIDNELLKYMKSIDQETGNKTKIMQLIEDSIFVRTIRLDLDHISPLIGLIVVRISNYSYNITHLSIHKSFRRQGLARLLLSTLANTLANTTISKPKCELVSCVILGNMNSGIALFRDLNFNEMFIDNKYHMLKSTQLFNKLINSPI